MVETVVSRTFHFLSFPFIPASASGQWDGGATQIPGGDGWDRAAMEPSLEPNPDPATWPLVAPRPSGRYVKMQCRGRGNGQLTPQKWCKIGSMSGSFVCCDRRTLVFRKKWAILLPKRAVLCNAVQPREKDQHFILVISLPLRAQTTQPHCNGGLSVNLARWIAEVAATRPDTRRCARFYGQVAATRPGACSWAVRFNRRSPSGQPAKSNGHVIVSLRLTIEFSKTSETCSRCTGSISPGSRNRCQYSHQNRHKLD